MKEQKNCWTVRFICIVQQFLFIIFVDGPRFWQKNVKITFESEFDNYVSYLNCPRVFSPASSIEHVKRAVGVHIPVGYHSCWNEMPIMPFALLDQISFLLLA